MNKHSWPLFLLLLTGSAAVVRAAEAPNFMVFMGAAQGWANLSVPMDDRNPEGSKSDFILTPKIDRIALAGARFSDFYAASPRCTPSRAAFFTGMPKPNPDYDPEGARSGDRGGSKGGGGKKRKPGKE